MNFVFFVDKVEAVRLIQMSHFALESTVNEVTKMDAPLERGPLLRWQRKAIEAGMRAVSIDGNFFLKLFCLQQQGYAGMGRSMSWS